MRVLVLLVMAFFSMTFVACGDEDKGSGVEDEIVKEGDTSEGDDTKDEEAPKEDAPVYCEAGQLKCGGACVPPNSPDNCGACGKMCLSDETCRLEGSEWACRCQVGYERCAGGCVSVDINERCGSCTNRCTGNERCERSGGAYRCLCYDGNLLVNMNTDSKNCGSCGYVCPSWRDGRGGIKNSGEEQCINSVCVCDNGLSSCEDAKGHMQACAFDLLKGESITNEDGLAVVRHCGECKRQCDPGFICVEGVCMCGEKESCKDGEQCSAGICECGKDAELCSDDQICGDGFCKCLNDDACSGDESCDLETGRCVCGASGMSCRDGETCVGDRCKCGNSEVCPAELICNGVACVCAANHNTACPMNTVCTSEGCVCGTRVCENYEYCFKKSDSETYCLCQGETDFCAYKEHCSVEGLGCRCGASLDKCREGESCDGNRCYCEVVGKKRCSGGATCVNGKCFCGGGSECNVGEACVSIGCECRPGSGIACVSCEICEHGKCTCGRAKCLPEAADNCFMHTAYDGECRCGTGSACAPHQACRDGKCECRERACKSNEVCSYSGQCRCDSHLCSADESCRPEEYRIGLRCFCDLDTCNEGERCKDGICTSCGLIPACLSTRCHHQESLCGCNTDNDCPHQEVCKFGFCMCGDDRPCRSGSSCQLTQVGRRCIGGSCYRNESLYPFRLQESGLIYNGCVCTSSGPYSRGCGYGQRCDDFGSCLGQFEIP